MRSRSRQHSARRKAEQVQDEVIWVLGLDSERVEDSVGKIFEVHGHNDIRPAADGGSKDMAVTGIGEIQAWNQVFIASYKGIQACLSIRYRVRSRCARVRSGRLMSTFLIHSS
jgi:hypothetical protein